MYEEICYKEPFLKEVIARIDFPVPVEDINKNLSQKIANVAVKIFPIPEHQKKELREVKFSSSDVSTKRSESMEWHFYGKNREKKLIISSSAIIFSYSVYKEYEILKSEIESILNVIFDKYKDLKASRVGLRYINIISVPGDEDALSWDKYIHNKLLGIFSFETQKEYLSRIFHILEYNFSDLRLRYQFGIANPDYPAIIRKKEYVLDLDAFLEEILDPSDISGKIDRAHDTIQDFFEKSITENTRKLMKPASKKENNL